MPDHDPQFVERTVLMDTEAIDGALRRLAQEIINETPNIETLALMGVLRRGRPLADRLAARIEEMTGDAPKVGSLATTLYRDDLRSGTHRGPVSFAETRFDFNVDGLNIVLVDDVLATGRTIRAALDEIMDYGRPRRIQLAVLVDRCQREIPIQADYLGWVLSSAPDEHVQVLLEEDDGEDAVLLERRAAPTDETEDNTEGE